MSCRVKFNPYCQYSTSAPSLAFALICVLNYFRVNPFGDEVRCCRGRQSIHFYSKNSQSILTSLFFVVEPTLTVFATLNTGRLASSNPLCLGFLISRPHFARLGQIKRILVFSRIGCAETRGNVCSDRAGCIFNVSYSKLPILEYTAKLVLILQSYKLFEENLSQFFNFVGFSHNSK